MKRLFVFLCVLSASVVALAADNTAKIDAILASPEAARAEWGIKVVSLDSGKTLYAVNEHKFFTPASNTKLFTTAMALTTLGPQFQFRTTVESPTPFDKYGRVEGDLWLVGRGDPNLSARTLPYRSRPEREVSPVHVLDELADQVVTSGVRFVDGDIVADDSYFVFERFGEGWSQDDLVWWFGAPVSALSINDNVLFLEVLPGEKPGDRALVKVEPAQDYYQIENRVRTVPGNSGRGSRVTPGGAATEEGSSRRIFINREPGSYTLEIWGRIPDNDPGMREQVAMEDPALFAGKYLREALVQRGITVLGKVRVRHAHPYEFDDLTTPPEPVTPAPAAQRQVLAKYDSKPLSADLKVINKVSQNLHAEMLLRTVARERRGIGSVAAGLQEMKAFLQRAGVPDDEYLFYDGSGLSRENLVTPSAVVTLLDYMDHQAASEIWRDLLPVAGVDGTISDHMKDTPGAGRVLAKTGTLSHVTALSGYVTTLKGEHLAFSILVNNHNIRVQQMNSLLDRICLALVEDQPTAR